MHARRPSPALSASRPAAVGAVTDAFGSLAYALNVSAAMLALGVIAAACQGKLTKPAG